jgi:DNA-binding MarR family transcriptional regulator
MDELESLEDTVTESWLQTLGIQALVEWDVLVYLYRHQTSLLNAEQISHLLNYGVSTIANALNALESTGLAERSRARKGVRLHRLVTPADPHRQEAFEQLMALDDLRSVRLLLIRRQRRQQAGELG